MHPGSVVYRIYRQCLAFLFFSCLLCNFLLPSSQAQITLDGSLGPRDTLKGPEYVIPAKVGQRHGGNLFHSFGQFNIQKGERATFRGPASVNNIFSRVTGGNPSVINGLLWSDIPRANLYLLNPSGVVFGPHAQLDVGASFHVSTANVIRFRDGATFSANVAAESGLTISHPVAFGFLDNNPARIAIQGSQLSVTAGATLSVTGGDITIKASQLVAPGGRIYLTSVASPGDVQVEVGEAASRLMENRPTRLGAMLIRDGALVNAGGARGGTILVEAETVTLANEALISNSTFGAGPSGEVGITTHDLTLHTGSGICSLTDFGSPVDAGNVRVEARTVAIRDGSFISSITEGTGRSGNVTVMGDILVMDGLSHITTTSGVFGTNDAGNVRVEAQRVSLTNGAQIFSGTFGSGDGGDLTVLAQDAVTLDGFGGLPPEGQDVVPSAITTSSQEGSTGNAGNVRVKAQTVTLTNGAQIQSGTLGSGQAGNLTVLAQDAVTLDGFGGGLLSLITASTEATGDAGSVRVEAQTVTATNGAQISSVTFGAGQGGSVTVMARERVTFVGTSPEDADLQGEVVPGDRTFPSGAFVNSHRAGAPGIVQVRAPEVRLAEGGRISSLNIEAEAAGGTVLVHASDTLAIAGVGSSLRTRSFGPGQGGDIVVTAGTVRLTEGADLSAASIPTNDAEGSGDAGDVTVTVRESLLIQHSFVTTAATQADGGDITLRVQDVLRLRDSEVTATVGGGPETVGGNITIDPTFVILEGSQIRANAFEGRGGNIQITTEVFLADPDSVVSAIALAPQVGIDGVVDIQAPVADLSGTVIALPQTFTQATVLLPQRCAERLQGQPVSTFVLAGRDSMPTQPGGVLPSPLVVGKERGEQTVANPTIGHGMLALHHGRLDMDEQSRSRVQGWPPQSVSPAALDLACAAWRSSGLAPHYMSQEKARRRDDLNKLYQQAYR